MHHKNWSFSLNSTAFVINSQQFFLQYIAFYFIVIATPSKIYKVISLILLEGCFLFHSIYVILNSKYISYLFCSIIDLFSIVISNICMFYAPLFRQLGLATFDDQPYWSQKHFEHMNKVHLLTSRVTVDYFLSVKSSIQLKQQNALLLQLVSLLQFRSYV